ncbi:gamma-glutamyltranspeptidase [Polychytrium aggregatum]|uniref:gamma-glutamyltranspeptidase n=1 Tax=Polychytrium aggregatum TaxID=110093 RepID=UPI0022FF0493|nr:gamma-glutamyltranspeptidase [Polychytrium aggregatum]KAI9206192.1 gamma-glutamyltranspeptidase [Polychytrium aggregatum]
MALPIRRLLCLGDRRFMRLRLRSIVLVVLVVVVGTTLFTSFDISKRSNPQPRVSTPGLVVARNGAVSSENGICSEIGVEVLKDGGSAVDAAVATGFCIGVTNSYSSGIGGGGFMVVRQPNGNSSFLDFREQAPGAATEDMFTQDPKLAQVGGLAVGVPGEPMGYHEAHRRYGKLPWKRLVQPAADLCIEGWTVSPLLAQRIATAEPWLLKDPAFSAVFAPNGTGLKEGQHIKRVTLGKTLQIIADEGVDSFYRGSIAHSLVKTVQGAGGILTLEDLANYRVHVNETVVGYYHGRKVITGPPPSSGAVFITIMNILEGYDLRGEGLTLLNYHRIIEAFKYAYAQRGFYGDPADAVFSNITSIMHKFIDKDLAAAYRHNTSDDHTFNDIQHYQPEYYIKDNHGTMHVSVLTADGSAVSLTSTVNLIFGARLMDPETGIILNDEMDDFSIPGVSNAFGLAPSPYNFIKPGKRMTSSSVPAIIERDGEVELVVGASGGSMIPTASMWTTLCTLEFGMDPLEALRLPRIHHQLFPNLASLEYSVDPAIERSLISRGHNVTRLAPSAFTGVSVVKKLKDGTIQAAADPRKGGLAAGY